MIKSEDKRIELTINDLSIECRVMFDELETLIGNAVRVDRPIPYDISSLSEQDRNDLINVLKLHGHTVSVQVNSIEIAW